MLFLRGNRCGKCDQSDSDAKGKRQSFRHSWGRFSAAGLRNRKLRSGENSLQRHRTRTNDNRPYRSAEAGDKSKTVTESSAFEAHVNADLAIFRVVKRTKGRRADARLNVGRVRPGECELEAHTNSVVII